jgi:FkbM family methyltransferase
MQLENFIPNEYLVNNKIELPQHITHVNIDIGLSFNAPVSCEWLLRNPNMIVFGFEPNSHNVELLMGLDHNNSPISNSNQYVKTEIQRFINNRFFIFPFALSNYNGSATFYNIKNEINKDSKIYEYDSGSSSLLKPASMEYYETEVQVFKLQDFLSQINWKKTHFINQVKIDAQGEDFKIIYGMGKYIKKIRIISYEINAPGYIGYKNYKLKNLKMFIYMYLNGFRYLKRTSSDIVFTNNRFKSSEESVSIIGT